MYEFTVNSDLLLGIISVFLAVLFDWVPVTATWFDRQPEGTKKMLNAGLLFLAAAVLYAGQCGGIFKTNYVCDTKGALDLVVLWGIAVGINQGIHFGTKPSKARKARLLKQPA